MLHVLLTACFLFPLASRLYYCMSSFSETAAYSLIKHSCMEFVEYPCTARSMAYAFILMCWHVFIGHFLLSVFCVVFHSFLSAAIVYSCMILYSNAMLSLSLALNNLAKM